MADYRRGRGVVPQTARGVVVVAWTVRGNFHHLMEERSGTGHDLILEFLTGKHTHSYVLPDNACMEQRLTVTVCTLYIDGGAYRAGRACCWPYHSVLPPN